MLGTVGFGDNKGFGIRGPALMVSGGSSARPAGLGVRNLGCRLWGLLRVSGLGAVVSGLGFRV